jgi:cobalt-zinc-cadmium efflux system membrane fusion protein
MNQTLTPLLAFAFASILLGCDGAADHASSEGHAAEGHGDADEHAAEAGTLAMSSAERDAQGIATARVERRGLSATISAPGEVRRNAYRSALVTPRISEARYVAAEVARQRSYSTVAAYGMTEAQIDELLTSSDASQAMGEFDLLSPRAGTVIFDDFVVGELVEPGRMLFEISDESVLWVEAQLNSVDVARVAPGTVARVSRDGERWLEGTVVQLRHQLDETTRTQGVRIEVENRDDRLHPGDYVDVVLATAATSDVMAVPSDAIVLMNGEPSVFKVGGDELYPVQVESGASASGWTEIKAGMAVGDEVVTQGAFLVKSLLLKSRMGEGHAH